ncbi:WD repeat protein [Viridothelium virens]|uniref:WD repeat protein n=1 Tax=Viridothelium virens TaxID=1048519 RepID=A0A6A6HKJ3_VIRVR|nr:WD repeat protein [Viridothelium virens]
MEGDVSGDEEALRNYLGTSSFGKKSRDANIEAQIDRSKRQPAAASGPDAKGSSKSSGESAAYEDSDNAAERSEDDDDDDDDDEEEDDEFPVSHELLVKTHERAVTTITLDPSGTRMITGSTDCTLKIHDFASWTPTTVRAFKSVDPTASKHSTNVETHPVHHAVFNPLSPSQVLVITALPQAKIFTRDGEMETQFVKGDMYLRDMHNTKGHISEITTGTWHPTNRNQCVTAGTDSTLRIWDVNEQRSQKEVIVHKSRAAGSAGRTRMTAVVWASPRQGGNNILVSAALDGSLAMWSGDGPYSRPAGEVRNAHVPDTWTGGIDVSPDGRLVVTRGGDNTIKLWDTRKFKQPLNTAQHQSTFLQYPTTNIQFSPTGSNVITGSEDGSLHILNPATLKPELITPVTPGSALITVLWHEKLNQIITGSANAETHVLYNPNLSSGGAKLVMSKAPKRRHIDDDPNLTMDLSQGISGDSAATPGDRAPPGSFAARHPTVGLTYSGRSRDPRRPHIPQSTPFAKNNPDEKHIMANIPLSSMRDEDPREALLKYADKAKNDPLFTNAWKTTQPKTIYAEFSDDEGDKAPEKKKQKT